LACVIAAPCSGSGKTLLSLCLAALARQRGASLQPFKVGPDYLDPQLLSEVAGRSCRNLDTQLCGEEWVRRCFRWHGSRTERVLVEGVMGLFDGRGPTSEGSTAEVAALLELPVVLVVEASRQAGSLAALVRGFRDHGPPQVTLAGVVLNRVGSERHRALLAEALAAIDVPLLGVLPHDPSLALPSRHLGLLPPGELEDLVERRRQWADLAARHLDLERLWPLLESPEPPPPGTVDPIHWVLERGRSGDGGDPALWLPLQAQADPCGVARAEGGTSGLLTASCSGGREGSSAGRLPSSLAVPPPEPDPSCRVPLPVAIASDQAFHFRYPEVSELLLALGLQPHPWSPLADAPLPAGCRAVLLPGGYPELHAEQLAASRRSLGALAAAARGRVPVVAECGGLLLLGQRLHDPDDRPHAMAGVLPFSARRGSLTLGYRQAEAHCDGLLVRRGERLIGHEFHRWQLRPDPPVPTDAAAVPWVEPRQSQALQADGEGARPLASSLIRTDWTAAPMATAPGLWQLEGWGWPGRPEGWTNAALHASWLHLHWAGCPVIPLRLAAAAASAVPLPTNGDFCSPRTPAPPRAGSVGG
jgi:cobyrinic acid a,c-diamide synthase